MTQSVANILEQVRKATSWLAYRRAAGQIRSIADADGSVFSNHVKVAFVSSFTIDPLADYTVVEAAADSIFVETYVAPYGQYSQEILNVDSGLYRFGPDLTVLAIEPDLRRDAQYIDAMISPLAQQWKEKGSGVLLVCTYPVSPGWPMHVQASESDSRLRQINEQLKAALDGNAHVHVFDMDAMATYAGYANALSPEMKAMARVPFSEVFLKMLAQKLCSHIKAVKGWSQKCLVLDCDNTLWGGIIGEDGLHGITLGPDCPGREFVDFQKAILELYEQGIILAINSKNNQSDVLEVLGRHPHMVLREEHFAAMVINWENKADNMQRIAEQLNIGLDSMVFADDNPAERQLLRQVYPQVKLLDLPANPALYAQTLRRTSFFTRQSLSHEDRHRGAMYAAQRQRTELQKSSVSLEDFLKSLEMVCSIRKAEASDVKRAAQLTQRTNQFNLTTRRYTESDIAAMLPDDRWAVYVLGLKDKFGDNGTVGLALVEKLPGHWRVDTFLMSCRVIGRQAEDALVDRICRDAVSCSAAYMAAEYIPTPKNAIVSDFWDKMQFAKTSSAENASTYKMDLKGYCPKTFPYLQVE